MPLNVLAQGKLVACAHPATVSGTGRPVPLVATTFTVRIVGGLALVTTERIFRNAEEQSIEATMSFPTPVHATLLGLQAKIGDRLVVGCAQRRVQARQTYEDALETGKTTVLHEELLRGVHMISVGHVAPGAELSVVGTWAMPMSASRDGATLRIPVTVGDVYGRSLLPESDDLTYGPEVHEATIEVSCADGVARLLGTALEGGSARVRLDAPIDLHVSAWRPRVLHGLAADGRPVTLGITPCQDEDGNLDVAVLADSSGSMNEVAGGVRGQEGRSKHDVLVEGLRRIASAMRPSDKVELWQFNTAPVLVGGHDLAAAIGKMSRSSGGTETGLAVTAVVGNRRTRDVILITDGKSHALDVQAAARSGRRFQVVLVGEDSLEANVGHLAALTGGQIFVAAGSDYASAARQTHEAIEAAFRAARAPHVAAPVVVGAPVQIETRIGGMSVQASWGSFPTGRGNDADDQAPATAEDPDSDAAIAQASSGDRRSANSDAELARAVGAVAASLAIPAMEEDAAASLAEAEGIVCHLTSLVLVDQAGEIQDVIPAQRKVATMIPRTMGGVAAPAPAPAGLVLRRAGTPSGADASLNQSFFHGEVRMPAPVGRSRVQMSRTRVVADTDALANGGPSAFGMSGLVASSPATAIVDMSSIVGCVAWSASPEALHEGDISGLPQHVRDLLQSAALTKEVAALAAAIGASALQVAVALLAKRDGASDRTAARVACAVLGSKVGDLIAAAERALGL